MSNPGHPTPPRRVRITSPRKSAARRDPARTRAADLDEQTGLGEVYVDSLMRAQRRLSLALLLGLAIVALGLPALLLAVPQLHSVTIVRIPLPWLLLGVLIYPFAVIVVWSYVRAAERLEREFAELFERP
ncbi:DUF4212 domain-containing protein [Gephyromycinifex aptenodytis]|uniref:DUF4212 domain-containing protein n=1 Tax=Gephyromycinifex aptenodytis TaxID=2716227 RepID=UPI0014472C65|nr:DUF4212 domain-containing protein [Gephyromycinifex aptenodytis]